MVKKNGMENEKRFAGCIGSMINIFDLSTGTARTKMLTQKPHIDVASHQSDLLKRPIGNVANKIDNTQVTSDQRRSPPIKKPSGTPIKTHIAQEMRKEVKGNQKPPTVVARLMGLDSMPMQQQSKRCPYPDIKQEVKSYQLPEDANFDNQTGRCLEKKIQRDVYEVCHRASKSYQINAQSLDNGIYDESSHIARTALVQQKFVEAKRLATDENFLHSKEFRDAIEVLSSNRDLFLKFLEEPNSLFSEHFCCSQSAPLSSQTKHITVLKPLSANEERGQKGREEQLYQADENVERHRHHRRLSFPETEPLPLSQPTRIVVLKPSPADPHDVKDATTSMSNLSGQLYGQVSYGSLRTDDAIGSRELAKEITRRMRESLSKNRRDGDLLSSVLSSGYVGDESSFHKTESDYMEEEICSLSNLEIATPTSQHSWDFLKRAGSPCSLSSSDQASHSSESSVVREAKKRLSERLALVGSSVNCQDQRQENRSWSTLGEMLAISASKKEEVIHDSSSRFSSGEDHLEAPLTPFSNDLTKDECSENNSPIMLSRSLSLPVSLSMYESSASNVGIPSSFINGLAINKEVRQSKTVKSSLKGKFTSLLFSRNKKQNKEKRTLVSSENPDDRLQHGTANVQGVQGVPKADDQMECANNVCVHPDKPAKCHQTAASIYDDSDMEQCQQRAIRDLETKISYHLNNSLSRASGNILAGHPQALSRSPPIESVARSLSRSNPYLEATVSYPIKSFLSKADKEQTQFIFVEKLISSAALRIDKSGLIFTSWYSLDVPLNPLLLDEVVYMKEDEDDDIKHHEKRSDKHLLFDCANEALFDLDLRTMWALYPWIGRHSCVAPKGGIVGATLAEEVWGVIKSWICREDCSVVQFRSNNLNSVPDYLADKEIRGSQWALSMWLEMHEFSKEIGGKLLEDLIEEALSELIA